jgi:hypothetical protein
MDLLTGWNLLSRSYFGAAAAQEQEAAGTLGNHAMPYCPWHKKGLIFRQTYLIGSLAIAIQKHDTQNTVQHHEQLLAVQMPFSTVISGSVLNS